MYRVVRSAGTGVLYRGQKSGAAVANVFFGVTAADASAAASAVSGPISVPVHRGTKNWFRRISPVAECLDQSPLTEPAADARPRGWGLLFMPDIVEKVLEQN